SGPATRFIQVVDAAPTCTAPAPIALRPGSSRAVTFSCTDAFDDPLSYAIDSQPTKGSLLGTGGSRTYSAGQTPGTDSFTWHAHSDTTGDSATQTQPITLDPGANGAPVCQP